MDELFELHVPQLGMQNSVDCEPGVLVVFIFPATRLWANSRQLYSAETLGVFESKLPAPERWRPLGFDIVEAGLGISGLSNTAFSDTDKEGLKRFRQTINDFGLIGDFDSAAAFAEIRSLQVTKHAPFVPVRLLCLGELKLS